VLTRRADLCRDGRGSALSRLESERAVYVDIPFEPLASDARPEDAATVTCLFQQGDDHPAQGLTDGEGQPGWDRSDEAVRESGKTCAQALAGVAVPGKVHRDRTKPAVRRGRAHLAELSDSPAYRAVHQHGHPVSTAPLTRVESHVHGDPAAPETSGDQSAHGDHQCSFRSSMASTRAASARTSRTVWDEIRPSVRW
jgi:hypothetical protein